MKRIGKFMLSIGIVFMLLSTGVDVTATKGGIEKVDTPFARTVAMSGAAANVNGVPYQYVILQGEPAVLAVYKLPSKELIDQVRLPKSTAAWAITTDKSGQAWIGGTPTAALYSYNPANKKLINHGTPDSSHTSILDLEVVGDAIYGSTAPNGKVFKFQNGKFATIGAATGIQKNARSLAFQTGSNRLFVGSGSKASLIVWDLKTNKKTEILPAKYRTESDVYDLDFAEGLIFAKLSPSKKVLVFDAKTNKFMKELAVGSRGVSSPLDGNVYYSYMTNSSTSLYQFNTKSSITKDMKINLAGTEAVSMDFVKLPSGDTMLTGLLGNTGTHLLYNQTKNKVEISKLNLPKQSVPIHTISSDGKGSIFTSGYVSGQVSILNPITKNKTQITSIGQVEGMTPYNGGMYLGVYPAGDVMYYHPETNPHGKTVFSVSQNGQNRPISLAIAPNEKVLAVGSHPKQGTVSGSLSYYNLNTKKVVNRKAPFPNQSIVALTYSNGYFYGGTSTFANSKSGGIGIAKFFRIPANNINAKPEELPSPIAKPRLISAMITGPSSTIWGVADGTVFIYNSKTMKSKTIPVVSRTSGQIRNGSLVDGKDGFIYGTIENKLFRIHSTSFKLELLGTQQSNGVALGADGNIYFTTAGDILRYNK
ncbi:hypothetical protein AM499_11500 [Bacillus sp. FJAT-22090]|uniref:WD40 repeat domain-containing protein n=1 Tax=Bacillus sp. FJAT-22090 TaxID=1581038 RepID=UPI0006AFD492|nr:WD40 repeat domain-containing protein [Bacillus sp. FJAT-22090]ALC86385.1 hypothetical protein AM499_11500 [Bacillus sp. FJAT-22090]